MTADSPCKEIFKKFLIHADPHKEGKSSEKEYIKAK